METITVVTYKTPDNSNRAAIVKPLRAGKLRIITGSDSGPVMKTVNGSEAKFMEPLLRKGKPYSIKRACNHYLKQRKTLGLGKMVKKELKKIKQDLVVDYANI